MTFPITPLASIHVDPFAAQEAQLQLQAAWNTFQAIFSQLPAQIITAVVNAILTAFGLQAFEGDYDALIAQLNTAMQAIPGDVITGYTAIEQEILDAIANALGHSGTGHTPTQVLGYLEAIPGSVISGATTIEQETLDAIANALGHSGTGHTPSDILTYLGEIPGNVISGALNPLVTLEGNAVNALFSAAGLLGSAIDGAIELANVPTGIPNTNILGQFTATVGADIAGVGAAIAAFFGIGGTPTMTAIQTAAAPTAAQLDSATNIANAVEAYLATQPISNPPNVAMADGSFPSFNHELLAGPTLPTINVTPTSSVAATIVLPATGTQGVPIASVAWLGGVLTGVTSIIINIYQWNIANTLAYPTNTNNLPFPSHTANIPVLLFSSPNQQSTTDTVLGYSFYDFPAAGSSPPPAATAGMSPAVFTAPLGTKYLVEMQTLGSTYALAGIQHQAPSRDNAVPKYMGATRGPSAPTFGAVGASGSGSGSFSYTHVIGASDTAILIDVANVGSGTVSVTVGGVAATLLGATNLEANANTITFGLLNPPIGSKTIAVTGAGNLMTANSVSYPAVSAFGTYVGTSGTSNAPSQSISSTANQLVHQAMAADLPTTGNVFSAYNKTSRWNKAETSGANLAALSGDFTGASGSVTGSATLPSSVHWASAMVPLVGVVAAAPSTIPTLAAAGGAAPAYSTNVPFLELCGSAGVSQHAPVSTTYTTAGTHSYVIPSVTNGGWMQAGDKLDIVGIGAAGSGEYPTTTEIIGIGGSPGTWNGTTLVLGTDIPVNATISIAIGAGGAGVPLGASPSFSPIGSPTPGNAGTDTTASATGWTGGFTAAHGAGGVGTGTTPSPSSKRDGIAAGNYTFNGTTYFGGAAGTLGNPADAPGAGGSGGNNAPAVPDFFPSSTGADGALFVTAYNG